MSFKLTTVFPLSCFFVIHSTIHSDFLLNAKTVSGVHARIEKKDGVLLVTDLDSTNGTFIGEKRLKPGVAAPLSSGSYITFGTLSLTCLCLFGLFSGFMRSPKTK